MIVDFTNRDVDGPIYEILDGDQTVAATFGIPEFKALLAEQGAGE